MSSEDPIGIIELGNINIKCLIFKVNNNTTEILGTSIVSSQGIHNDFIINLSKASNAIRSCISNAEKKAKITLKKINVILEQPDFLCTKFSKHKKIDGSKIHKEDIEFLLKEAKKQLTRNDENQTIIHIFNYNYIVDGKKFIEEPINVYADQLTHEITFITAPKNNLKNINQVLIDCDLEIERLISRTFTLGVELLDYRDLEFGSAVIDLGYEKISFGLFKDLALVHSSTFPIGVNHIVKDISKVCSLNLDESKNIQNDFDFSFQDNKKLFDEKENLKKSYFINSSYRKISKNLIFNVIRSRLDEIFKILKKQLIISELSSNSGTKLLLAGGGSNLNNLEKSFISFFGLNVKTVSNFFAKDKEFEEKFFSCLGALKIIKEGWETEAIPEENSRNIEKASFFAKIFRIRK